MTQNLSVPPSEVAQTLRLSPAASGPRRLWRWVAAAGVLITIGVIGAALLSGRSGQVRFQTAKIERGNLTVTVTATGTLQPTNQVDVGSELSGIVRTVHVDSTTPSRPVRRSPASTPPSSGRRCCSPRRC